MASVRLERMSIAAVSGAVAIVVSMGAVSAGETIVAKQEKWQPWAEIGGYSSNRADAQRGEAAFWAPLFQGNRAVLFTEVDGRFFDGDVQREANIALGFRQMLQEGWNLGLWAGFDRRRTETTNIFNQAAGGIELLSSNWDIRVNGYLPLDDAKAVSSAISGSAENSAAIIGNALYLVPGFQTRTDVSELAFSGADAEIGWRAPLAALFDSPAFAPESASSGNASLARLDLRIFAGGYYFENPDFSDAITGPRVRAELQIANIIPDLPGSRLTLEAAWQYDDVRDEQIEAGARLRIPLGASQDIAALTPQAERMTERLRRDTDIVARTKKVETSVGGGAPELAMDADTEVVFNHVVTVANGSDLQAAITGVGSNSLIVALGGASSFDKVIMSDNQTLLGGGGAINVKSVTSNKEAVYTAPGTRPSIFNLADGVVGGGENTHIAHLDISGNIGAWQGIWVSGGAKHVLIDDVSISNVGDAVLLTGDDLYITIRNSTFSNVGWGVSAYYSRNHLSVLGNTFNDIVHDAITMGAADSANNNEITVTNNTFSGSIGGYLFFLAKGAIDMQNGSSNNVNVSTDNDGYCHIFTATVTGTVEFSTPPLSMSSATCN